MYSTDFGRKYFDGFLYKANYKCRGSAASYLTSVRSERCYTQCRAESSCKAFTVDSKAKCNLFQSCRQPIKAQKTYLWRKCNMKQCKICNTSLSTCDACKQGWGGKFCRRRVTTLPPSTTNPISTDVGTKMFVKILLYVLFSATLLSCLGYLIGNRHFRRKQRRR